MNITPMTTVRKRFDPTFTLTLCLTALAVFAAAWLFAPEARAAEAHAKKPHATAPHATDSHEQEKQDNAIKTAILEALKHEPVTESYQFTVSVDKGVVTLEGLVDSTRERDLSQRIVSGINGVKELHNQVKTQRQPVRGSEDIKEEILENFRTHGVQFIDQIRIAVSNGVVTISGRVPDAEARKEIESLARVSGVVDVNVDDLKK